MTNKPSIAISLVNIDSFQLLNPALTSLIESDLKEFDFKLFYWDNGSKDESVSFIESLEINKLVIKSDSNLGIVEPRIDLMDKIIAEDCWELVLEIHSDMLFPNIWLKPLLTKFDDNTGILLPYIIQQNEYLFDTTILEDLIAQHRSDKIIYNPIAVHPWLLSVKCIRDIGYYNPIYEKHRCEDDDFMIRVLFSKYDIKAYKGSIVFHKGGVVRKKYLKRNRNEKIFQKLYGITVKDFSRLLLQNGDPRIMLD